MIDPNASDAPIFLKNTEFLLSKDFPKLLRSRLETAKSQGKYRSSCSVDEDVKKLRRVIFSLYPRATFQQVIHSRQHTLLKMLAAAGFDLSEKDRYDNTPIEHAACSANFKAVKILFQNGAEVNHCSMGRSALCAIAFASHNVAKALEIAEYLIVQGADLTKQDHWGDTPLHSAIEKNFASLAEALLSHGAPPNLKNKKGKTPLHVAASIGSLASMDLLLKHGADINAEDNNGRTPIMDAISSNKCPEEAVLHLLSLGANLDTTDSDLISPLCLTLYYKKITLFNAFISHGVSVEKEISKKVPLLQTACRGAPLEIIQMIIEKGGDIHAIAKDGLSALHGAAQNDSPDCLKFLIDTYGLNVNIRTQAGTPLHSALKVIRPISLKIIRCLLESGADPTIQDDQGLFPYELLGPLEKNKKAYELSYQMEILELLKVEPCLSLESLINLPIKEVKRILTGKLKDAQSKGSYKAKKNENIEQTIHQFVYKHLYFESSLKWIKKMDSSVLEFEMLDLSIRKHSRFFTVFAATGFNLFQKSKIGKDTLLHVASEAGNLNAMKILAEKGIPLYSQDRSGNTPLHETVNEKNKDLTLAAAQFLIDRGADLLSENKRDLTPLHLAAEKNFIPMILKLLSIKLSPNIKNKKGQTPLHAAASHGCMEAIEILLENGADINAKDFKNRTPLFGAILNKKDEVALKLIASGVELNTVDSDQKTPLYYALFTENIPVYKTLLSSGASIENEIKNLIPLLLAASRSSPIEIIEEIIANGGDVFSKDTNGESVLHIAVSHNTPAIAKLFVSKYGVNVNATSNSGDTPFILALYKLYEKSKHDIDYDNGCISILSLDTASAEMVQCLLSLGADHSIPSEYDHLELVFEEYKKTFASRQAKED